MSGKRSCACTEPSPKVTSEWPIRCGCSTTSTRSRGRSKSQVASMTSSPLFIKLAESIVIFGPIDHVGCRSACSGVTPSSSPVDRLRRAPPEAVIVNRSMARYGSPCRHCQIALCSLSMGTSRPPCASCAEMIGPAMINVSLLASATSFPARRAASVGTRPAAPDVPTTTRSTSGRETISERPPGPRSRSIPGKRCSLGTRSERATAWGRNSAACLDNRCSFIPVAKPLTRIRPPLLRTTSSVCRPIEPVLPSRTRLRAMNQKRGVVTECAGKQQAVDPVEQAPVARHDSSRILHTHLPLEHRFDQIADLPHGPTQEPECNGLPPGKMHHPDPCKPAQRRKCQPAGDSLKRLFCADMGHKWDSAPGSASEESTGVVGPGNHQDEHDPPRPSVGLAQQSQQPQEQPDVHRSGHGQGPVGNYPMPERRDDVSRTGKHHQKDHDSNPSRLRPGLCQRQDGKRDRGRHGQNGHGPVAAGVTEPEKLELANERGESDEHGKGRPAEVVHTEDNGNTNRRAGNAGDDVAARPVRGRIPPPLIACRTCGSARSRPESPRAGLPAQSRATG